METLARYGVVTSSTVIRAVQALRTRSLLTAKDPAAIADPYLAEWVGASTLPPRPSGG